MAFEATARFRCDGPGCESAIDRRIRRHEPAVEAERICMHAAIEMGWEVHSRRWYCPRCSAARKEDRGGIQGDRDPGM